MPPNAPARVTLYSLITLVFANATTTQETDDED